MFGLKQHPLYIQSLEKTLSTKKRESLLLSLLKIMYIVQTLFLSVCLLFRLLRYPFLI